jgi:mRNA-degrading endonuclease RelE of RelBE toxin-antitoxin system
MALPFKAFFHYKLKENAKKITAYKRREYVHVYKFQLPLDLVIIYSFIHSDLSYWPKIYNSVTLVRKRIWL